MSSYNVIVSFVDRRRFTLPMFCHSYSTTLYSLVISHFNGQTRLHGSLTLRITPFFSGF